MNLKKILKHNAKLYIAMGIIILLGTIGITLALTTSNFNPIPVNTTTSTIDAEVTYDEGTNSSVITTTGGEILPIADSIIEEQGESITDTRVIKAQFNVSGLTSNPANTIYDIALYSNDTETSQGINCELRTEDVKWRLYKNGNLISNGNLSPSFDVMNNGRLVLTSTQQDLTTTPDKYTFILWVSESCTGDITTCDPSKNQNKYLNKTINASLKIELATKSKKTLTRITSDELSCNYTSIDIPVCNQLTYNTNDQALLNSSNYYKIENNTGNLAGAYKTILKLNDGYKWSDGTTEDKTINCNIMKKDVIITTSPQTISYGTNISTNLSNLTVEGLLTGHTLKSASITPNNATVGTNTINVSNAVIVDSNNNDVTNNYEVIYNNTGTLTVNCLNSSTLPTANDYTYTGESFTGITGGTNIEINGVSTATEIGTYTVTITPKNNYCWTDGTTEPKTLSWNIYDNAVIVSLDDQLAETEKNGTSTLYYKDNTYYTNTNYTKAMSTTSNPISLPIKVGYTFDGYYTEEDGNGTQMITSDGYATEDLLNTDLSLISTYSLKQSITLYANWTQKTYTIKYNANGGTGAPSSQTKTHGESLILTDIKATEEYGRPFLGWSTNKNATTPTYLPGDTLTINSNITLYAVWMETIEYINGGNYDYLGEGELFNSENVVIPEYFEGSYCGETNEDEECRTVWFKVVGLEQTYYNDAGNDCDESTQCTYVKSITIPSTVRYIDAYFFTSSPAFKINSILVDKNNKNYTSIDGVLYDKNITKLIKYPQQKTETSFDIPESVTSIGADAFRGCSHLTTITIPNSVISIEIDAFNGCSSLTTITIPDSVTSIGGRAFKGCTSLTDITIPNSVTSIGRSTFEGCTSLTDITIPNSVTSIQDSAFKGCSRLTTITIPDSVTTIEREAFYSCSRLTTITIPDNVTTIGAYAFDDCTSLTTINVDSNNANYSSIDGVLYSKNIDVLIKYPPKKTETSFDIPESVTTIRGYAFDGCSSLTTITIPDSVTSIGNYTFYGCTSLTEITIPNSVLSIGFFAFYRCDALADIYYTGTETQWNTITIDSSNTPLTNATKHFEYVAS